MSELIYLEQMKSGESGKIVELATDNRRILGKLMSLGIVPGLSIRLLRCSPGFLLQAGYTKVALDREFAGFIRIRRES